MPLRYVPELEKRMCFRHDWVGGKTCTECPDCAAEQRDRYREALEKIANPDPNALASHTIARLALKS